MKELPSIRIYAAKRQDVDDLFRIERICFQTDRRASLRSLMSSIESVHQSVWVAKQVGSAEILGSMVLHHHPKTLRIYSVAVLPAWRGAGLGRKFMAKAFKLARAAGCHYVSLEMDFRNKKLLAWYRHRGFVESHLIPGYYGSGRDALRMRKQVKPRIFKTGEASHGRSEPAHS